MKRLIVSVGILVSFWLGPSIPVFGQTQYGYHFTKKRSFYRIPFQFHSNLIILPVRVNQSDTLRFILDTGVSTTIITDPVVAQKLGLKFSRKVKIAGAGEGGQLSASVSIGNQIQMGLIKAENQNIVVLDEDILAISEFVGVPIHGIFGFDVFNSFVITIDFNLRELLFEKPEKYRYRKSKGEKYPISIEETKPFLSDFYIIENNQKLPIKALIDSGAGHALSINLHANPNITPPQQQVRAQLGRGLSGNINGSLGRLPQVQLGKFKLQDIVASFPDSTSYSNKFSPSAIRQGNIGCELLRRFRVTFNYPDSYILLKPVRKSIKESFEHNMSGMELIAKGTNFKDFVIDRIIDDSPANDAGLLPGDHIIVINGRPTASLTITDIYKILQRGQNKEVSILIRRDDRLIFTSFLLKRLI